MRGRNTPLLTVEIPQLQDVKVCLGTKANTEKITPYRLDFRVQTNEGSTMIQLWEFYMIHNRRFEWLSIPDIARFLSPIIYYF